MMMLATTAPLTLVTTETPCVITNPKATEINRIYTTGTKNRSLNLRLFNFTPAGNFTWRLVEIAQIHPRIPSEKTNNTTGKTESKRTGLENVTTFMKMGSPQVIKKSCQCFSLSRNLMQYIGAR
ncbi:hypothetical protein GCM10023183_17130 [Nibribacter koreensis]|uniref:Secreted protein n=1 Tax=Nibribacter koreensis TaxID=1084519 RepID=A0ABP8FHM3_9BACT